MRAPSTSTVSNVHNYKKIKDAAAQKKVREAQGVNPQDTGSTEQTDHADRTGPTRPTRDTAQEHELRKTDVKAITVLPHHPTLLSLML